MNAEFLTDVLKYKDWLKRTPEGFVADLYSPPLRDYFVIHHASCETIQRNASLSAQSVHFSEDEYRKVVARSPDDLVRWAMIRGFAANTPHICQLCCFGQELATDPVQVFGQPLDFLETDIRGRHLVDHTGKDGPFYRYTDREMHLVRVDRWVLLFRRSSPTERQEETGYCGIGQIGRIRRDNSYSPGSPRNERGWRCELKNFREFDQPVSWTRVDVNTCEADTATAQPTTVRELPPSLFVDILRQVPFSSDAFGAEMATSPPSHPHELTQMPALSIIQKACDAVNKKSWEAKRNEAVRVAKEQGLVVTKGEVMTYAPLLSGAALMAICQLLGESGAYANRRKLLQRIAMSESG